MKTVVVRNIHRTDAGVVKRLGALGVATVHEAYGRIGLMKPYLRPAWAGGEAAGTAVTVLAQPGDNWMIHVAVEQCQPGDILVVGCTADNTDGMFGELLATSCQAHGITGLVIDAGVRDVESTVEVGGKVPCVALDGADLHPDQIGDFVSTGQCGRREVEGGDARSAPGHRNRVESDVTLDVQHVETFDASTVGHRIQGSILERRQRISPGDERVEIVDPVGSRGVKGRQGLPVLNVRFHARPPGTEGTVVTIHALTVWSLQGRDSATIKGGSVDIDVQQPSHRRAIGQPERSNDSVGDDVRRVLADVVGDG